MADKRFFQHSGALTLAAVTELTGATAVDGAGRPANSERHFQDVAPLDQAGVNEISFLDNVKYLDQFADSKAGACFVRQKFAARAPKNMLLLLTEEPYTAYAITAAAFYPDEAGSGISPQAHIAKSAVIGANCSIGAGTVIGEGVTIGDNCRIGALCSVTHTLMGDNVTLHRGVHIGQDGFGFAPGPKGIVKVPQLGRVIIGNHVEIGSGSCIDRGAGPDTIIGDNSKIDNLVQIGHNVQIGKYVVIAAQCGIAGHIHIGAGAKIAARSGVMHDVPAGATYGGAPAVPIKEWHRQTLAISKLSAKQ